MATKKNMVQYWCFPSNKCSKHVTMVQKRSAFLPTTTPWGYARDLDGRLRIAARLKRRGVGLGLTEPNSRPVSNAFFSEASGWFKERTRVTHDGVTSKKHCVSHGHWTRKNMVKHHGLTGSGFALLGCAPCHMVACRHVSCWRSSHINWSQWNFARRTSQRCHHRFFSFSSCKGDPCADLQVLGNSLYIIGPADSHHRYPSLIMTRTWLRWRSLLAWGCHSPDKI